MAEKKTEKKMEKKKKTITIDITDWYDKIKELSQREIRSIEEQCKFFIKQGIEYAGGFTRITYIGETSPSISSWVTTNPCGNSNASRAFTDDDVTYHSTGTSKSDLFVNCEQNPITGLFEQKQ